MVPISIVMRDKKKRKKFSRNVMNSLDKREKV